MGIRATIFRDSGARCANGGISDHLNEVTIINASGPFEPTPEAPAVEIKLGRARNLIAVPLHHPTDCTVGPMMGGTFINTSDSRFSEICSRVLGRDFYGAVALHDRWETQAQNNALSV